MVLSWQRIEGLNAVVLEEAHVDGTVVRILLEELLDSINGESGLSEILVTLE